jgi:hypothetical protein
MPTNVNRQPGGLPAGLRAMNVLNPVSAGHGARWSQDLSFLLGYNVHRIGAHAYATGFASSAGGTRDISMLYSRSPGAQVVVVAVEVPYGAIAGLAQPTTVSLPSATLLPPSTGLDGSPSPLAPTAPAAAAVHTAPIVGYLDVSAVPVGTIQQLTFTYERSGVGAFKSIFAAEMPLDQIEPFGLPTTEVGVAEPTTRDRIVDGSASDGYGMVRVVSSLDSARKDMRFHANMVCRPQDDLYALIRTGSTAVGNFSITENLGTYVWLGELRFRVRRLFTTATPNQYTWGVVYKTSNAGVGGKVRLTVTPVGGIATAYDISLAGTTSWTYASMSVPLPCSGTDQVVGITHSGAINNAAEKLYLATSALIENEA